MTTRPLRIISERNKFFLKDDQTIYYLSHKNTPKPVPNVDYKTFEVISGSLAKDDNNVYAISTMKEGLIIFDEIDIPTAVFFPEELSHSYFADQCNFFHYNHHFIQYKNVKYLSDEEQILVEYLKENFPNKKAWWNYTEDFYDALQLLSGNHYKSDDHIFYFFKDDQDLYDHPTYDTRISGFNTRHEGCFLGIMDADLSTFSVLNEIYSKDKKQVYFHSRKINADPDSFEVLHQLFAKDKNGIWYNGRLASLIEDKETFEILTQDGRRCDGHRSKDKFYEYTSEGKYSFIKHKGYAFILKKKTKKKKGEI